MAIEIKVKDQAEGKAIRMALIDPVSRAAVVLIGTLMQLPKNERRAALKRVQELLED